MRKLAFDTIICLLTSYLMSACAPAVQTIEVTRIVQQTVIVTRYAESSLEPYPFVNPYPFASPGVSEPRNLTPTPIWTPTSTVTPFIKSTQGSPSLTDPQISEKITACYPVVSGCGACEPKLNNSVQHVVGTTRTFINVPKDLYPKELFRYAATTNGQATMGWISNAGLPGEAFAGSPQCWSTYVEFDGQGEVDLRIPSILIGVPDYYVRFIVD